MCARLSRSSKTALAIMVVLLVTVLVAILRTDGVILFRTDRRVYDRDDYIRGALLNLSRHAIEVRASEPLIYELTDFGWIPPFFGYSSFYVCPRAYEPGWMQSGSVLSVDMSFVEAKASEQRWILLEQQYFYDGNEYVVYSNMFVIDRSGQPPIFRTLPAGLIEIPSIRADVIEPYVISLSNGAIQAIWFNPICSDINVDDWPTDYYPFATLQRQTGEGTWQVLRPDRSECSTASEPIRIGPGETLQLSLAGEYSPSSMLEPGTYRWHLVYYPVPFSQCSDLCKELFSGHLFTGAFDW